jgi:hypothetical protein
MALRVPRDTSATARAVALRAVSSGAINRRAGNTELSDSLRSELDRRDIVTKHIATMLITACTLAACVSSAPDSAPATASSAQALAGRGCSETDDGDGHYAGCMVIYDSGGGYILPGPANGHGGLSEAACNICGVAVSNDLCAIYDECAGASGAGDGGGWGGGGGNPCGNGCFMDSANDCHCGGRDI